MNRDIRLLSSFFLSTWLIDRPTGRLLLRSLLDGTGTSAETPETLALRNPTLYANHVQPAQGSTAETGHHAAPNAGLFDGFTAAIRAALAGDSQPGCIAVITVDYPLYDWYADYLCRQLMTAHRDENVVGIILKIDSPGGVDQAAYRIADMISMCDKPIVGMSYYGLMASAAYWVGSACDYVIASRATDRIGSIGVYIPFIDDTGYYENMGFTIRDVYAPESTEKNIEYRSAQEGDFKLLEQSGSMCAQTFIASVKKTRGKKLNAKAGNPFKGKLYYASDALALGLIDEIGPLERAAEVIANLVNGIDVSVTALPGIDEDEAEEELEEGADPNDDPKNPDPDATTNQSTLNQSTMGLFGNPHKKLATFKGREASAITDEEINDANAELTAEGITGAIIVNAGWVQEAQDSLAALATTKASLATAEKDRDKFKADAATFGAQPGVLGTKTAKTQEDAAGDEDVFMSETDMELHRREAKFKRP